MPSAIIKFRILILNALLLASPLLGQEQSVKPGINEKFLDPALRVEEWTERFETESREIFHEREKIAAAVALKPGMSVADIAQAVTIAGMFR
mgnify:CR=1 FL=1